MLGAYPCQVSGEGVSHGVESFFEGCPEGLQLFRAVEAVVAQIGEAGVRVTKSQIAFWRRKGFAYVWRPRQYVASCRWHVKTDPVSATEN